jgi:hypothetical protein
MADGDARVPQRAHGIARCAGGAGETLVHPHSRKDGREGALDEDRLMDR